MDNSGVTISGTGVTALADELGGQLGDCLTYRHGNVCIFYTQSYSFRVKSNLMVSVILDFSVKDRCTAEIIAGGGGEGLLGITWGSESSRVGKVEKLLRQICQSHKWQIDGADN